MTLLHMYVTNLGINILTTPTLGETETLIRSTCTDPYLYPRPISSYKICNLVFILCY